MTTTIASVVAPSPDMIHAGVEAELVGRSAATVSRARRRPDHPAGPTQLLLDLDRGRRVPASAVAALTQAGLYSGAGITTAGRALLDAAVVEIGRERYVLGPRGEIVAWWARRRRAGRPRRGGSGSVPDGWSRRQWQALRDLRDGQEPNPVMARLLQGRGAITEAGRLTAPSRRLLTKYAPTSGDATR